MHTKYLILVLQSRDKNVYLFYYSLKKKFAINPQIPCIPNCSAWSTIIISIFDITHTAMGLLCKCTSQ